MQFARFTDLEQLPKSADALFAQAAHNSVFSSRPWIEHLLAQELGHSESLLLACAIEGKQVRALLPLVRSDAATLRSVGHLYSSLFTLLLDAGNNEEAVSCLAKGIASLPVRSLRLIPTASQDPNLALFEAHMLTQGFTAHRYFAFYNWFHRLHNPSFAEYMAARPSRLRNTIARKQRKLNREYGYSIALSGGNDLQPLLDDYNAVYHASWKANEVHRDFVDDLARVLAAKGWLRLAVLYIRGQPAAAQFWFVVHRKASIFKLVYDEHWKAYSPGSILTHYLMKHVIDVDQVTEIDFLTGNDAYKADWMTERQERQGLYLVRKTSNLGMMDTLKRWLQRHIERS